MVEQRRFQLRGFHCISSSIVVGVIAPAPFLARVAVISLESGLEHHVHDAVALVEVGHGVGVALLLLYHAGQRRQEVHEERPVQVLAQL